MNNSIIFMLVLGILFLIVSFMAQYKYKVYLVFLNLIFIIFCYYSVSQIISTPMPLDYNIPLFINEKVLEDGVEINYFSVSNNNKKIDFVLNYKNVSGFYQIDFDPVLMKELKDALKKAGKDGDTKIHLRKNLTKNRKSDNRHNTGDDNGEFSVDTIQSHNSDVQQKPSMEVKDGVEEYR